MRILHPDSPWVGEDEVNDDGIVVVTTRSELATMAGAINEALEADDEGGFDARRGPLRDVQVLAVVSRWFDLPLDLLAGGRAEPYLAVEGRASEFHNHATAAGATWREVDIGDAADIGAVIDALKGVLPFPGWCGSSWDAVEDAFEELRRGWPLPLASAFHGGGVPES